MANEMLMREASIVLYRVQKWIHNNGDKNAAHMPQELYEALETYRLKLAHAGKAN